MADKETGLINDSPELDVSFQNITNHELLTNPINDTRQLSMIDRFKLGTTERGMSTRGFIFMTRPNLNLFKTTANDPGNYKVSESLVLNDDIARLPTFNYIYKLGLNGHKEELVNLGKRIYCSLEYFGTYGIINNGIKMNSPWLSIITNQANSYSPADREIDTVDVSTTFHGNKVVYAEPTFKHKIGGTISIDFTDRRDLSLYYTLKLWVDYIQQVSIGTVSPLRRYIVNGILDYAVSLYYIVTDETMENIVYWEKLTGVFPLSVPDSMFKTSDNSLNPNDLKYTINFAYSMRSVQYENHLMEINALYNITSETDRFISGNSDGLVVGDSATSELTLRKYIQNVINRQNEPSNELKESGYEYFMVNKNQIAKFLPNFIVDKNIHGTPYVNGPVITCGANDSGTKEKNKNIAKGNVGQFKMRWI